MALFITGLLLVTGTVAGQTVEKTVTKSQARNTGGYDLNLYYEGSSHIAHIQAQGNMKKSLTPKEMLQQVRDSATTWALSSSDTSIAEVATPVQTTGTNGSFFYNLYPETTLHVPDGYETSAAAWVNKVSGNEEVFEAKGFQAGRTGDYTLPIGGRTANWGITTDKIDTGVYFYYGMDLEYRITLSPKQYHLYLFPGQGSYQGNSGVTGRSVIYHDTAGNEPGSAVCQGYRFEGWFTVGGVQVFDAAGRWTEGKYWDAAGRWIGTQDMTLFARWTKTDDFSFSETISGIELEDFDPDDSGSAETAFRLGDGEKVFFPGLEDGVMYSIEEDGAADWQASCQLEDDHRQSRLHAKAGASLRTPTRVLASDAAAAFVNAEDDGTSEEETTDSDDQPLHDLTICKEYDGVYDASSVTASFRVQLTGLVPGTSYTARKRGEDGAILDTADFKAEEDGRASYSFSLRDTQSMQLCRLPASATYQITEEADAKAAPSYVLTSEETAGIQATTGQAQKGEVLSTPEETMDADRSYSFYNCIEIEPVKTVRNELAGTGNGEAENAAAANAGETEGAAEGFQNRVDALDDAWIYHIHQEVEVPVRSFRVYDTLPPYVRIIGLPGTTERTSTAGEASDLRSCGLRAFWRSPEGAVCGGDVTAQDARTGEYLIRGASGEDADAVLFRIRYDEEDGEEITLQVMAEDEDMMLQGGSFDLYFLAGVAPEASHEQLVAADCYRNGNYRFVNEASTVIGEYLCTSRPVTTRIPGPAISHDLILQKNVAGDLGDRTKHFAFQVDFAGLTPGERYDTPASEAFLAAETSAAESVNPENSASELRSIPITADDQGKASMTVTLRDDEAAVFPGLPRGAKYQIQEAASDHAPSYRQRMLMAAETAQWLAWMAAKESAEGTSSEAGGSAASHPSGTDSTDDFDEWLEGEEEEFRQVYTEDAEDRPFLKSEDAAGRAGQPLQTETETVDGDVGETILVTFTNHRSLATITGLMGGRVLWPAAMAIIFGGGALWLRFGRRKEI